jgi:hypothetical protein
VTFGLSFTFGSDLRTNAGLRGGRGREASVSNKVQEAPAGLEFFGTVRVMWHGPLTLSLSTTCHRNTDQFCIFLKLRPPMLKRNSRTPVQSKSGASRI